MANMKYYLPAQPAPQHPTYIRIIPLGTAIDGDNILNVQ
jgi:hypothetical protein